MTDLKRNLAFATHVAGPGPGCQPSNSPFLSTLYPISEVFASKLLHGIRVLVSATTCLCLLPHSCEISLLFLQPAEAESGSFENLNELESADLLLFHY